MHHCLNILLNCLINWGIKLGHMTKIVFGGVVMAKISFDDYCNNIEGLSNDEKFEIILKDICCQDLPIFYGIVEKRKSAYSEYINYFITNVCKIHSHMQIKYPYKNKDEFVDVFFRNHIKLAEGEKVFFSANLGRLNTPNELLEVYRIFKFSDVLGKDNYTEADFNYENLRNIISKFNPLKMNLLTNVENRLDNYKIISDHLSEEIENKSKILKQLNEDAQSIFDILNKLEEKSEVVHQNFIEAYPEAKRLINKKSAIKLNSVGFKNVKKSLKYNYEDYKIELFISALNTTQIIALCGKPGSGKTTFAEQMASAVGACFHLIEVQNNWTDSTDLLGFYNPTNNTYQSVKFLEALLMAKTDFEINGEDAKLHLICLDEMNLSRVEYYFATFLSLLQRDEEKRLITLLPRDVEVAARIDGNEKLLRYAEFLLPPNVRFVGTMNIDDTAQFLSPKVIDRSIFIEFDGENIPDENKNYVADKFYIPYTEFSKKGINVDGCIEEINKISSVTPRLAKYIKTMWAIYKKIADNDVNYFTDNIILGKILPALENVIDANNLQLFTNSKARYERGLNSKYRFDENVWSFWE